MSKIAQFCELSIAKGPSRQVCVYFRYNKISASFRRFLATIVRQKIMFVLRRLSLLVIYKLFCHTIMENVNRRLFFTHVRHHMERFDNVRLIRYCSDHLLSQPKHRNFGSVACIRIPTLL